MGNGIFASKKIRIGILGAGCSIGRSCHAIQLGNVLILVDAGMNPGVAFIPQNTADLLPLLVNETGRIGLEHMMQGIDSVLLVVTHAHHDHAGAVIPIADYIGDNFPNVKFQILMTAPTWRFCEISWAESARTMQNKNSEWVSLKPLFDEHDILRIRDKVKISDPGIEHTLSEDIRVMLIPAGHILGAVSVAINAWGMHFVHTGDIAFDDHYLVPGATTFPLPNLKVLFSEGTYAGEKDIARDTVEGECAQSALHVLNRGGVALFPAFQIDRAQELMEMLLQAGVPRSKIYLDGGVRPMCKVYKEFLKKDWSDCFIQGRKHREDVLLKNESCIVIASGGMLKGASLEWAKGIIGREESAILLNGWAEPCSPARQLIDILGIKDDGAIKELKVEDEDGEEKRYPVRCELNFFHLSGHAHGGQLEEYWREMRPEHLILVHTEGEKAGLYLEKNKNNLGASHVHLPQNGIIIDL